MKDLAEAFFNLKEGCGWQVVLALPVDLNHLRQAVEAGPAISLENVLEVAREEQKRMAHLYLGSEHLLLAMVRGSSVVAKVLAEEGIDLEGVRQQVMRELDPNYQAPRE